MKKNLLLLLAIMAFFMNSFIYSVNAVDINSNEYLEYLKRSDKMLEISEKIEKQLVNEKGEYPSYYGGRYINDDATNMVIQIVEKNFDKVSHKEVSNFRELLQTDNLIKVEYVKYSYNELLDVYDKINDYYEKFDNTVINSEFTDYSGHYIDVKNNCVVVNLYDRFSKDYSVYGLRKIESLTSKFKEEVISSEIINYGIEAEGSDESSVLKAGQGYTTKGVVDGCSVGYRVKIGNKNGFITAGHCVNGLNYRLDVGIVKKYKYSGTVDAAFVQTNSNYVVSNSLAAGPVKQLNITMSPILTVGSPIAHVGTKSGYKAGKILATNSEITIDGVKFTDLIATDYVSTDGDSGGIVLIPRSNGEGIIAGIHKGRRDNNVVKVAVKAHNIQADFGYNYY